MGPKSNKPSLKLLPPPSLTHSGVRIAALSLLLRLRHFATPLHLMALGVLVYLGLTIAFTASFFWPRSVDFSFAGTNCFTSPTLLPNLVSKQQGQTFTAAPHASVSIAGYPLYAHTTCVSPIAAPAENATDHITFRPLGLAFLSKTIRVSSGILPVVSYQESLAGPISTKDPLTLPLGSADEVFEYRLLVNDQPLMCEKSERAIACDVAKLELAQSASYTFALERLFEGRPAETLFEQTATTVGAVHIASSSIAAGQTVHNVPTEIVLTANKTIQAFSGVELVRVAGDSREKVPVTATTDDQTITVRLKEPLERNASFELNVQSIIAPDGGYLTAPFVLPFATSGGPKVLSANIGSYKVATTASIVLNFDSAVSISQNLANYIQLQIGGSTVDASISLKGNTVTIKPKSALGGCTRFTVRVLDGLQNEFGISGGSAWQLNSRTICQSVFSIGTSVQGRSILAYRFGNGSSKILFVGTTHGDEKSSTHTLNSFIDYLEKNYDNIPAHRTIVVVPNLNPDAYALSKRTNANNVDLNRNFPANNWKQGVTMPGGSYNPNGGGSAPLSEPESSAIANYTLSLSPRLVLTYHAAAGVVIPNDAGDSDALAKIYDQKSNLNYADAAQTSSLFTYDTTGAYEDWLLDKHNLPAILVELWTKSSNEFTKNQNAMWHMVTLP